MSSMLPGFYKLTRDQRRELLASEADISPEQLGCLFGDVGLGHERADRMVENALGTFELPLGLCVNMQVDGEDRLIPMVVEEPSVVAAASHAAKLMRLGGGVRTEVTAPEMIGQVQLLEIDDLEAAADAIMARKDELIAAANACDPLLVKFGGGARDIELRPLPPMDDDDPLGPMLVFHLIVDVRDAMGANAINTMVEHLAPTLEEITGGRARLRILSNLADRRRVVARARIPISAFKARADADSSSVAHGIQEASVFAERDPYRAATHNKGIMNGIDAVLIAFGQDWRAVEAGAHAYAARSGRYTAMARWRVRGDFLEGELDLPMAVGIIGGVVRVHPTVKATLGLAQVKNAGDMASLVAAAGLAQNLGALRALSDEGIQSGHMRLHARNVAAEAGATLAEVDAVAEAISRRGHVSQDEAERVLRELRHDTAKAS